MPLASPHPAPLGAPQQMDALHVSAIDALGQLADGRYGAAFELADVLAAANDVPPSAVLLTALVLALRGRRSEAAKALLLLGDRAHGTTALARAVARAWLALGDRELAEMWLLRAAERSDASAAAHLRTHAFMLKNASEVPQTVLRAWLDCPPVSAPLRVAAAQWLLWEGKHEEAVELLRHDVHSGLADSVALTADAHLWTARWDEAERALRSLKEGDPRLNWRLGAVALGRGEWRRGLAFLERGVIVCSEADRGAALLCRAECLLRLGYAQRAESDLAQARLLGNSLPGELLLALAKMGRARWGSGRVAETGEGFYAELFVPLCREFLYRAPPPDDPEAVVGTLWSLLGAMAGNRTQHATWLRERDGLLMPVKVQSSREAAAGALKDLGRVGPDQVERELLLLAQVHPNSPHPFTYLGELQLWRGDWRGAQRAFEQALRRRPARWAYVGLFATFEMQGRPWRAWWAELQGRKRFGELASATTHVYRGEWSRRRGRTQAARRDLEIAVATKPTRVAAWMNLALIYLTLGRMEACHTAMDRVNALAPGLIWEASLAAGLPATTAATPTNLWPVVETALHLMRGNRSSTQITFWLNEELRVLPSVAAWRRVAQEAARELAKME